MNITVDYEYTMDWIPPRCRKPRPGVFNGSIDVEIEEVAAKDAQWACVVYGSRRYDNMVPINPLRYYNGRFYERAMTDMKIETSNWHHWHRHIGYSHGKKIYEKRSYVSNDYECCYQQRGMTIDDVVKNLYFVRSSAGSEESNRRRIQDEADRFILVNDEVWERVNEPRYVVQTFGLGHNHGGTCWFVEYGYNNNISKESYFNANDFERMVERYFEVALGRGDTEDAHRYATYLQDEHPYYYIEVLRPELFTCCPMKEHGDGDPFIRQLNEIAANAGNALEAGLLAMAVTANEIRY